MNGRRSEKTSFVKTSAGKKNGSMCLVPPAGAMMGAVRQANRCARRNQLKIRILHQNTRAPLDFNFLLICSAPLFSNPGVLLYQQIHSCLRTNPEQPEAVR